MAVQSARDVTTLMHLSGTEGSIFPLIPHVAPIWPLEKRMENVKPRKTTFWKLVRNKMIVLRFLQSINPTITDLFSQVADEEELLGSNIVALTRNFQEEEKRKHERVFQIQMEAYRRAEKKKSVWDKAREREWATEWRVTTERLPARNGYSTTLTSQSQRLTRNSRATTKIHHLHQHDIQTLDHNEDFTPAKAQQRKHKAQTFRSLKEEFGFAEETHGIYLPHISRNGLGAKRPLNDPRFERLLNSLIPPPNKREKEFRNTGSNRNKDIREKETVSSARLSGKSLQKKWPETMAPKYNAKNVSNSKFKQAKFTRPVGGLWHSF